MRYVEEFWDLIVVKFVLLKIEKVVEEIGVINENLVYIMEICGGYIYVIFCYGLDCLMLVGIEFIYGFGCLVCVLFMSWIDECVEIVEWLEVIFIIFGDVMWVFGFWKFLFQVKVDGVDICMVYLLFDVLELVC